MNAKNITMLSCLVASTAMAVGCAVDAYRQRKKREVMEGRASHWHEECEKAEAEVRVVKGRERQHEVELEIARGRADDAALKLAAEKTKAAEPCVCPAHAELKTAKAQLANHALLTDAELAGLRSEVARLEKELLSKTSRKRATPRKRAAAKKTVTA